MGMRVWATTERLLSQVPRRFAFVHSSDALPVIARFTDLLLRFLSEQNFQTTKIEILTASEWSGPLKFKGAHDPNHSTSRMSLFGLRRLAAELRAHQPEVVHTVGTRAALLARLAAYSVGPRPFLVASDYRPDRLLPIASWLDQATRDMSDVYLTGSFEERARLLRQTRLRPERVRALPVAIPRRWVAGLEAAEARCRLGIEGARLTILSLLGPDESDLRFSLEVIAELDHRGLASFLCIGVQEANAGGVLSLLERETHRLGLRHFPRCCSGDEELLLAAWAADFILVPGADRRSAREFLLAQSGRAPVLCCSAILEACRLLLPSAAVEEISERDPVAWADRICALREAENPRPLPRPHIPTLEEVIVDYLQCLAGYRRARALRAR